MTTKFLTFWNLVEALDQPTLISMPTNVSMAYELGHKPVAVLQKPISGKYHNYAAKVGPSLFAAYCTRHPIAINLWHAYRGTAWEFASVYAMPEGRTLYRYWHLAVSRQDAQWQRKVCLERYCHAHTSEDGECSLPETLKSRLPLGKRLALTMGSGFAVLDGDGSLIDVLVEYGKRLFAVASTGNANHAVLSPALPSHTWWRPARIARSYADTLRRDLQPMGDYFVKPYCLYRQHNTSEAGWHAALYVCSGAGEFGPPFLVSDRTKVERLAEQKSDILSWAANSVYIPGPTI